MKPLSTPKARNFKVAETAAERTKLDVLKPDPSFVKRSIEEVREPLRVKLQFASEKRQEWIEVPNYSALQKILVEYKGSLTGLVFDHSDE